MFARIRYTVLLSEYRTKNARIIARVGRGYLGRRRFHGIKKRVKQFYEFMKLVRQMNISNDISLLTTHPHHVPQVVTWRIFLLALVHQFCSHNSDKSVACATELFQQHPGFSMNPYSIQFSLLSAWASYGKAKVIREDFLEEAVEVFISSFPGAFVNLDKQKDSNFKMGSSKSGKLLSTHITNLEDSAALTSTRGALAPAWVPWTRPTPYKNVINGHYIDPVALFRGGLAEEIEFMVFKAALQLSGRGAVTTMLMATSVSVAMQSLHVVKKPKKQKSFRKQKSIMGGGMSRTESNSQLTRNDSSSVLAPSFVLALPPSKHSGTHESTDDAHNPGEHGHETKTDNTEANHHGPDGIVPPVPAMITRNDSSAFSSKPKSHTARARMAKKLNKSYRYVDPMKPNVEEEEPGANEPMTARNAKDKAHKVMQQMLSSFAAQCSRVKMLIHDSKKRMIPELAEEMTLKADALINIYAAAPHRVIATKNIVFHDTNILRFVPRTGANNALGGINTSRSASSKTGRKGRTSKLTSRSSGDDDAHRVPLSAVVQIIAAGDSIIVRGVLKSPFPPDSNSNSINSVSQRFLIPTPSVPAAVAVAAALADDQPSVIDHTNTNAYGSDIYPVNSIPHPPPSVSVCDLSQMSLRPLVLMPREVRMALDLLQRRRELEEREKQRQRDELRKLRGLPAEARSTFLVNNAPSSDTVMKYLIDFLFKHVRLVSCSTRRRSPIIQQQQQQQELQQELQDQEQQVPVSARFGGNKRSRRSSKKKSSKPSNKGRTSKSSEKDSLNSPTNSSPMLSPRKLGGLGGSLNLESIDEIDEQDKIILMSGELEAVDVGNDSNKIDTVNEDGVEENGSPHENANDNSGSNTSENSDNDEDSGDDTSDDYDSDDSDDEEMADIVDSIAKMRRFQVRVDHLEGEFGVHDDDDVEGSGAEVAGDAAMRWAATHTASLRFCLPGKLRYKAIFRSLLICPYFFNVRR
jgi:hypothetical protein